MKGENTTHRGRPGGAEEGGQEPGSSPCPSSPSASRVVGRLAPGCSCGWVGGPAQVGRAQTHWRPFSTNLSLFSCLGPPGRRGKPGRRGDPGESQVFLVPRPRPRSLPLTWTQPDAPAPGTPHYSGRLVLGRIFFSLPFPATALEATVPKIAFSWLLVITVPVIVPSMSLATSKSHHQPQKCQSLVSHSETASPLCGN